MNKDWPARAGYAVACIAAIGLGLASRRYSSSLPPFVATYAGDTIWAAMVFSGISMLWVHKPLAWRAGAALAFCYAIEVSQLYHAAWIDDVRRTTFGALVLDRGFLFSDLLCYTVGIAFATATDAAIRRRPATTASTR